jgi:hypothetical protein
MYFGEINASAFINVVAIPIELVDANYSTITNFGWPTSTPTAPLA